MLHAIMIRLSLKNKKLSFLFPLLFVTVPGLLSQDVVLKGVVIDPVASRPVRGATVKCGTLTKKTGEEGDFYFELLPGIKRIVVTYAGYATQNYEITLKRDTSVVLLYEKIINIEEVTVKGDLINKFFRETEPGITRIQPSKFNYLPTVLGDADVLKKIQYLPGIHSGTEGSSGLIVRGGSYEHNLINLNGFPVYQPYHLMGFQSAFDPFFVDEIEIIKGGFPAKYGGRL